ncbi:hypothetical protein BHE74_00004336 [Ensete ventricosum]|nr:hypothetical protein BHE74_00004336 [Ensete ventricosum]RZR76662.1 hypothetical protein BHM03_00001523 [Ensete ventricosum]
MGRASSYKPPCGVTVGVEPAIEEDQNGQSNGGNGRIHERYVRPVTRIKIMEVLLTKKKAQLLVPVWRKASVLRCVQPILSVSLFPGHVDCSLCFTANSFSTGFSGVPLVSPKRWFRKIRKSSRSFSEGLLW